MSSMVPPNILTGWLGIDAIQQACASQFPSLAAVSPALVAQARALGPGIADSQPDPALQGLA